MLINFCDICNNYFIKKRTALVDKNIYNYNQMQSYWLNLNNILEDNETKEGVLKIKNIPQLDILNDKMEGIFKINSEEYNLDCSYF